MSGRFSESTGEEAAGGMPGRARTEAQGEAGSWPITNRHTQEEESMMHRSTRSRVLAAAIIASAVSMPPWQGCAEAGEAASASSPEAVVRMYIAGLGSGDYEGVVGLMDPAALDRLRDMMLPLFLEVPTKEDDPGGLGLLAGVATPEEARKLTGPGFFKAFFAGISNLNPAFAEAMRSTSGEIIGSVREGDDTVHVVCRSHTTVEAMTITKMLVVSLRSVGGEWRVLLSGEIEGMADNIKRALAQAAAQGT